MARLVILLMLVLLGACTTENAVAQQSGVLPNPTRASTPIPAPNYAATGMVLDRLQNELDAQLNAAVRTEEAASAHATQTQSEFERGLIVATMRSQEVRETGTAVAEASGTKRSEQLTATPLVYTATAMARRQMIEQRNASIGEATAPLWAGLRCGVVLFGMFMVWAIVSHLTSIHWYKIKYPYGEPAPAVSDGETSVEIVQPSTVVNITHLRDGAVSTRLNIGLPCTDEQLTLIAKDVLWNNRDRARKTIPINHWQRKGLGGVIVGTREWLVEHEYATFDPNNECVLNGDGVDFLQQWLDAHSTPLLRPGEPHYGLEAPRLT